MYLPNRLYAAVLRADRNNCRTHSLIKYIKFIVIYDTLLAVAILDSKRTQDRGRTRRGEHCRRDRCRAFTT